VPQARYFTSATILAKPFGHDFHVVDDGDYIIFALWEHNFWNGEPGWCTAGNARAHYIAMVHPDTNTTTPGGITKLGLGSYLEPLAWVKMVGTALSPFGDPGGGFTLAHEAAHNYNGDPSFGSRWKHVNCGLPAGGDFNPAWPYVDTLRIANDGPATGWGFDYYTREVIEPTEARDFMSYCSPKWISAYNRTGLFGVLSSPSAPVPAARPLPAALQGNDLLVVLGTIAAEPANSLMYGYRLAPEALTPKQSDMVARAYLTAPAGDPVYVLELLDGEDKLLASQPFTPTVAEELGVGLGAWAEPQGSETEILSYLVSIPYDPNAAAARITQDGLEISRLEISANAPTVNITSPANNATITDTLTLGWTAGDADGDDLRFNVLYSPDNGQNWLALATGYTSTTLVLTDTAEMLAGDPAAGLIRVVASDGVHTGDDQISGLTVANHPPQVTILNPAAGQRFSVGDSVVVAGQALDADDGPLGPDYMQWTLDGEVVNLAEIGGGLDFVLGDLPRGPHTLKLEAVDNAGAHAEVEIVFYIGDEVYLPIIGR